MTAVKHIQIFWYLDHIGLCCLRALLTNLSLNGMEKCVLLGFCGGYAWSKDLKMLMTDATSV